MTAALNSVAQAALSICLGQRWAKGRRTEHQGTQWGLSRQRESGMQEGRMTVSGHLLGSSPLRNLGVPIINVELG